MVALELLESQVQVELLIAEVQRRELQALSLGKRPLWTAKCQVQLL
jgi:hypothetical protein